MYVIRDILAILYVRRTKFTKTIIKIYIQNSVINRTTYQTIVFLCYNKISAITNIHILIYYNRIRVFKRIRVYGDFEPKC